MAEALLKKKKAAAIFSIYLFWLTEREYYSKYKSRNIFQRTLFNFNLIDIEVGGLDPPASSSIYKYWYSEVFVENNLFVKL